MKNKRKSAVANQNGCSLTSAVEHDTYIYQFADGTLSTLVFSSDGISDIDSSWLSELQELDRLEYNNNHAQTRRHCSLDAGKPIYGYECKRHHDTPRIRLQNEQGNPTPICEIKPVGQSKLELMASKIFERVWGDQREIVLQTCKMLDACYKPDADRRADLMKAKDDSIQLLQQQLDDLVVVRARGEIEQDKFLQRTIEIQQQMEALRQSKAQIASEDYNPGRLDMEAIEAALCEAVEMHDGLVSEDFIDLFVSQVTPLSDSRFAWCLDFSPQPTVAFLNLAGQRKYTTCSMDSKLHFGPFADGEEHTIPFPGSLRR